MSVLNPSRIRNRASCWLDPWPLKYSRMKIVRAPLPSLRDFYTQLNHFDPMLREDLAKNLDDLAPIPASANLALSFAEKLMLCPTPETARTCIRRDMAVVVFYIPVNIRCRLTLLQKKSPIFLLL